MDEATKLLRRELTDAMLDAAPDDLTADEVRRTWNALFDAAPDLSRAPAEAPPREPTDAEHDRGRVRRLCG